MTLPETRHSLFVRLQDAADHDAWAEFVRIYEPAVYRFARKRGMQHADASELSQDVLTRIIQAVPRWEPGRSRGSFRSWLFTVARSRLVDAWREAGRKRVSLGTAADDQRLDDLAGAVSGEDLDAELRREVIRTSSEQIRSEFHEATWQVFWRTSVDGEAIARVASDLKLSIGAAYAARSRVLARLRQHVQRTWSAWEAGAEARS
jgi:RNA polymerase sigma-70 factor (ECF subfamily)